jgi:hypothetical protein
MENEHLTKKQIEAEGWREIFKNLYINNKKEVFLKLYIGYHYDEIISFSISIYNDDGKLFRGKCPDIDTFRTICKLINI